MMDFKKNKWVVGIKGSTPGCKPAGIRSTRLQPTKN